MSRYRIELSENEYLQLVESLVEAREGALVEMSRVLDACETEGCRYGCRCAQCEIAQGAVNVAEQMVDLAVGAAQLCACGALSTEPDPSAGPICEECYDRVRAEQAEVDNFPASADCILCLCSYPQGSACVGCREARESAIVRATSQGVA